jgi:hypothetical protein
MGDSTTRLLGVIPMFAGPLEKYNKSTAIQLLQVYFGGLVLSHAGSRKERWLLLADDRS